MHETVHGTFILIPGKRRGAAIAQIVPMMNAQLSVVYMVVNTSDEKLLTAYGFRFLVEES